MFENLQNLSEQLKMLKPQLPQLHDFTWIRKIPEGYEGNMLRSENIASEPPAPFEYIAEGDTAVVS